MPLSESEKRAITPTDEVAKLYLLHQIRHTRGFKFVNDVDKYAELEKKRVKDAPTLTQMTELKNAIRRSSTIICHNLTNTSITSPLCCIKTNPIEGFDPQTQMKNLAYYFPHRNTAIVNRLIEDATPQSVDLVGNIIAKKMNEFDAKRSNMPIQNSMQEFHIGYGRTLTPDGDKLPSFFACIPQNWIP